jgi:hypothetical protein
VAFAETVELNLKQLVNAMLESRPDMSAFKSALKPAIQFRNDDIFNKIKEDADRRFDDDVKRQLLVHVVELVSENQLHLVERFLNIIRNSKKRMDALEHLLDITGGATHAFLFDLWTRWIGGPKNAARTIVSSKRHWIAKIMSNQQIPLEKRKDCFAEVISFSGQCADGEEVRRELFRQQVHVSEGIKLMDTTSSFLIFTTLIRMGRTDLIKLAPPRHKFWDELGSHLRLGHRRN